MRDSHGGDGILEFSICVISYKNHALFAFYIQYNMVK